MSTETEIAWAAGFFDGEGSFTLASNHKNEARYLKISMTQAASRAVLDRFQAAVGYGKVYGPYSRIGYTDFYNFQVQGKKAHIVAEILKPYLSPVKLEQLSKRIFDLTTAAETWKGANGNC